GVGADDPGGRPPPACAGAPPPPDPAKLRQPGLLDRPPEACRARLREEAVLPPHHGVELRRSAEQREPFVSELEEVARGEAARVVVAHEDVPPAAGGAAVEGDARHRARGEPAEPPVAQPP